LGGRIYFLGGIDGQSGMPGSRVDIYDPAMGVWTVGVPMARPMSGLVAATVGGRIIAVGPTGFSLDVEAQAFDPGAGTWTLLTPPPNRGRRSQGGADAAGRLYTIGGDAGGFESASVESFDVAANQWRVDAPMPTARALLTAVTIDVAGSPKILSFGGYGSTHVPDAGFFRTNEIYDPASNTWAVRAELPTPVASAAAVAFDRRVFTFGGTNVNRAINAVNRYDPVTDSWTPRAALPSPAIVRAEVVGRRIFVFTISEIWVYTPDNDIW
jgi:energy-converting hydrogenase Eha subunit A